MLCGRGRGREALNNLLMSLASRARFGIGFYAGIYVTEKTGLFFRQTIVHGFVVDASQGTHISGDSVPGTSLVAQVVLKLFQA